jgi:hypothetical protein
MKEFITALILVAIIIPLSLYAEYAERERVHEKKIQMMEFCSSVDQTYDYAKGGDTCVSKDERTEEIPE